MKGMKSLSKNNALIDVEDKNPANHSSLFETVKFDTSNVLSWPFIYAIRESYKLMTMSR